MITNGEGHNVVIKQRRRRFWIRTYIHIDFQAEIIDAEVEQAIYGL